MDLVVPLDQLGQVSAGTVGGKSVALGRMIQAGLRVPGGFCIGVDAYRSFLEETGLGNRIAMELARKPFDQMRWEELWDTALRVQHMFLSAPLPAGMVDEFSTSVRKHLREDPVAVRSSAPGEDSSRTSFAGLHDSYINVRGVQDILEAIRNVWASLWSNRALLYFKELNLDPRRSAMAVVIQRMVIGERSGIAFGKSPVHPDRTEIEAVYGLCQGLVDGQVEPDRWSLDSGTGQVLAHSPAQREHKLVSQEGEAGLHPLSAEESNRAPLSPGEIKEVFATVQAAEKLFGQAQDMEWTLHGKELYVLQSRPVTTPAPGDDERGWYLSLQDNFETLLSLKTTIEDERLPAMQQDSDALAAQNLERLDDAAIAKEMESRARRVDHWKRIYHDEFIPFAHGMRLFGEAYNRRVKPSDPYEFTRLLARGALQSMRRNRMLQDLGTMLRDDASLLESLQSGDATRHPDFERAFSVYLEEFGDPTCLATECEGARAPTIDLLLAFASGNPRVQEDSARSSKELERLFLESFPVHERLFAERLLDLGRSSWSLRDDDNIALGRIESQLRRVCLEASGRTSTRILAEALQAHCRQDKKDPNPDPVDAAAGFQVSPRQLLGQPAGPGVGKGSVRVIHRGEDLRRFQSGEILVCDAIDPNMTFVIPLAGAVVERRGGMLIHGAIIAREYGLPCVTGIPDVTRLLKTGDPVTVDGHLGIVTLHREPARIDTPKPE